MNKLYLHHSAVKVINHSELAFFNISRTLPGECLSVFFLYLTFLLPGYMTARVSLMVELHILAFSPGPQLLWPQWCVRWREQAQGFQCWVLSSAVVVLFFGLQIQSLYLLGQQKFTRALITRYRRTSGRITVLQHHQWCVSLFQMGFWKNFHFGTFGFQG